MATKIKAALLLKRLTGLKETLMQIFISRGLPRSLVFILGYLEGGWVLGALIKDFRPALKDLKIKHFQKIACNFKTI